ncbi:MAG: hypothetical protein M1817_000129 [Caeruleum heppii]|nr:MAG: hypothetical protein M1817_000129 [Caeruleum heppii]
MSSARSSSGGVGKLRAMFESGESTSDSPRGRSPAGSEEVHSSLGSHTPRRVSTVRSSFVSVESSGQLSSQLGSQPDDDARSTKSVADQRRDSFSVTDQKDPAAMKEMKQSIDQGLEERKKDPTVKETVPEVAISTPGSGTAQKEKSDGPNPSDDTTAATTNRAASHSIANMDGEATPTKAPSKHKVGSSSAASRSTNDSTTQLSSTPARKDHQLAPKDIPLPATPAAPTDTQVKAPIPSATKHPKANGQAKASTPARTTSRNVPAPISVSKSNVSSPKSSSLATSGPSKTTKTPTTPKVSPRLLSKSSRATAGTAGERRVSSTESKTLEIPTKAPTAGDVKAQQPSGPKEVAPKPAVRTSPKARTKPRSPTRPVQLPASATAPTASSVAKTSASGEASAAAAGKGVPRQDLRRQPSKLVSRDRPALGRPSNVSNAKADSQAGRHSLPGHRGTQRPASRSSTVGPKAADEGFLARMMRPTTSSSSKVHDKVEAVVKTSPKRTGTMGGKQSGAAGQAPTKMNGHARAENGRLSQNSSRQ